MSCTGPTFRIPHDPMDAQKRRSGCTPQQSGSMACFSRTAVIVCRLPQGTYDPLFSSNAMRLSVASSFLIISLTATSSAHSHEIEKGREPRGGAGRNDTLDAAPALQFKRLPRWPDLGLDDFAIKSNWTSVSNPNTLRPSMRFSNCP